MVANLCFQKQQTCLLITSKESQLAIQFSHYRLPLFPVQLCAVSREDIAANSSKFPFPMILVRDRKRVNVARYSGEDRWLDVREGVRGRLDEAFSLHFWGVRWPSRASRSRRAGRPMEQKTTFEHCLWN